MAGPYINTPATERRGDGNGVGGDMTSLSAHQIDFSFAQPFASPSKNPAEKLRNQMRGMRAPALPSQSQSQSHTQAPPKTPRVRAALVDKRNPAGHAPEFTPLLRSAQRKHMLQQSMLEDKENASNTMGKQLPGVGLIPNTPAVFRSSYASPAGANALPVNSSMLDTGDHSINNSSSLAHGASGDRATPAPPAPSSSILYDSTPMPQLPNRQRDGGGAVLDQGNALTLRDQEAKLDQIQKDNFGLKLKIHFLEDALRKSGNEYHQATVKENVELKTEKVSLEQDLKRQRKRLQDAARELQEYRLKYEEYQAWVKKRHASERESEELERLRHLAEQSQKVADQREQELEVMRVQLQEAEHVQGGESEDAQRLKDDVQDLEAEVRDRERQLEEKHEQLESLQDQLKTAKNDSEEVNHYQQDIDDLEADAKAKDAELNNLRARLKSAETSSNDQAMHLQQDIEELEAELQEKDAELDGQTAKAVALEFSLQTKATDLDECTTRLQSLQRRLASAEQSSKAELQQRDDDVRNAQRELADREGEIAALRERLQTARGSWDTEAQAVDARLREKEHLIREHEGCGREKARLLERCEEKDARLAKREDELHDLKSRLSTLEASENSRREEREEELRKLKTALKTKEDALADALKQATSLEARLGAMETPGKKESLVKQQAEHVRSLQLQLRKLGDDKEAELDEMEVRLKGLEVRNAGLEDQVVGMKKGKTDADAETDQLRAGLASHEEEIARLRSDVEQTRNKSKSQQRSLDTVRADARDALTNAQHRLQTLEAEHVSSRQALEDEILVLEAGLSDAQAEQSCLQTRVHDLEHELQSAWRAKDNDTPVRERNDLRLKLQTAEAMRHNLETKLQDVQAELVHAKTPGTPVREREELRNKLRAAQSQIQREQHHVEELQAELQTAQQDKTLRLERMDLHEVIKKSKLETEQLQLQMASAAKRESELRAQLAASRVDLKDAQVQLMDREVALGERAGSSSGHARREAELHAQLREAVLALESARLDAEKSGGEVQGLRDELEAQHQAYDPAQQDMLTQRLEAAGAEAQALKERLQQRENKLQAALKREHDAHRRLDAVEAGGNGKEQRRHEAELRGLAKQIQFLHAKCAREATFRADLTWAKEFFLKQVGLYSQCNQADLQLLQEMGITPDISQLEGKRRSLRAVGLMVLSTVRMGRLAREWESSRKVQESLCRKLKGMSRGQGKTM